MSGCKTNKPEPVKAVSSTEPKKLGDDSSAAVVQTQPARTMFKGFWVGMSASEFEASEHGKEAIYAYEHDKVTRQLIGTDAFPSWKQISNPNRKSSSILPWEDTTFVSDT